MKRVRIRKSGPNNAPKSTAGTRKDARNNLVRGKEGRKGTEKAAARLWGTWGAKRKKRVMGGEARLSELPRWAPLAKKSRVARTRGRKSLVVVKTCLPHR